MERREHQRASAYQPVSVSFGENSVQAELYDLSLGGLALLSETAFSAGSRLRIQLSVPSHGGEPMEVEVLRSVSKPDLLAKYITAAIFIDPDPKWLDAATEIIHD